jgi:hypothetical protein
VLGSFLLSFCGWLGKGWRVVLGAEEGEGRGLHEEDGGHYEGGEGSGYGLGLG